jgi:hypothetical protein
VSSVPSDSAPTVRRRRNPLIYFWVYSLARVTLFLVLWGLLWLFGLGGLIGAAVALLLSIPLSFVLLARPRAAMTASMMERLNVRQERTAALDDELSGGEEPAGGEDLTGGDDLTDGEELSGGGETPRGDETSH